MTESIRSVLCTTSNDRATSYYTVSYSFSHTVRFQSDWEIGCSDSTPQRKATAQIKELPRHERRRTGKVIGGGREGLLGDLDLDCGCSCSSSTAYCAHKQLGGDLGQPRLHTREGWRRAGHCSVYCSRYAVRYRIFT
eukprot:COSAG02_NODE_2426_length_8891_cov_4.565059_6_plen_137_part_00